MSTKIYQAWKFPVDRLNDFVSWYDAQVFPKVKKHFDFLLQQKLCKHPNDKMKVVLVGDKGDPNDDGSYFVSGLCNDCKDYINGKGKPSANVEPITTKVMHEFTGLMFDMKRRANKGEILATNCIWERNFAQGDDEFSRRFIAEKQIADKARQAGSSFERDPNYDLECGVSIRIYKNHCYAVPFGEFFSLLDEDTCPDFAEDFSYWNNSDPPDWAMSPENSPDDIYDREDLWTEGMKKWDAREKEWDEVYDAKTKSLMYYVINSRYGYGPGSLISLYGDNDDIE